MIRGVQAVLSMTRGWRAPAITPSSPTSTRSTPSRSLAAPVIDEKRLFDVIARAYLAALMPDFHYRQTTATLDVKGFPFKATGRQPIDLGWRAAFPEWQPADEKGDGALLLPPMRDGETARLRQSDRRDQGDKPPPRYNEGTLIEAMQNAWRFVEDEVLRDRLKEAKGIGTPATRAEIIGGLKMTGFSGRPGKEHRSHRDRAKTVRRTKTSRSGSGRSGRDGAARMPFGRCRRRQAGDGGAIDAVCDVALRIIGKLKDGSPNGAAPLLGSGRGARRANVHQRPR